MKAGKLSMVWAGVTAVTVWLICSAPACANLQDTANEANRLVMSGKYAEAIPLLKDLLTKLKGDQSPAVKALLDWAQFQLAVGYLNTEQPKQALQEFENYLRSYPAGQSRINVRLLMGEINATEAQWPKVLDCVSDALKEGTFNREQQLLGNQLVGEARYRLEKWAEALDPLLYVFRNGAEGQMRHEAAAMYTTCLVQLERYRELFEFLPQVFATPARFDIGLNIALIEGGDRGFESAKFDVALLLYRLVFTKAELLTQMERLIAGLRRQSENLSQASLSAPDLLTERRRIARVIKQYEEQIQRIKEFPDYDQELSIRIGRSYGALHRYWEAVLVFRALYDDYPDHKLADLALYSAFAAALEGQLEERAMVEGYDYLRLFPGGENWDRLTAALAQLHATREEFAKGLAVCQRALAVHPQHDFIAHITYVMAYCHFNLEQFPEALEKFGDVYQKYGDRGYAEPARYWHAMSHLFLRHYREAREEFAEFIQTYGATDLGEDAHYRYGVALYGEGNFSASEAALRTFLGKYPKNLVVSEAWTMIGDILASQAKLDEAIAAYRQGIATFQTMPQLNLATFQCARVYELEQRWDEIIQLCSEYLTKWGQKGNYSMAAYWIGTAHMRAGREQQAVDTFFDTIVNYGNDPHGFGVDAMMRDMMYEVGQKLNVEIRANFLQRIRKEVDHARALKLRTLELRLITLLSERIDDAEVRRTMIGSLLQEVNIAPASPLTLMVMGQHARENNLPDMARRIYTHFLTNFPTSEFAGDAYQAIAKEHIQAGRYAQAMPLLNELVERFASTKFAPEAQKLIGDVHRLQERYEQALAAYNAVLSVKEWRGPLWAESVYWIGECLRAQGHAKEAFAYYQRLYVLYEGYTDWAAKGYLRSGQILEKLDQRDAAIRTYQEMLAKPDFAKTPEYLEAQQELKRLGGGA
jgi:TolA-binding protein